jgi:hypothetical protein
VLLDLDAVGIVRAHLVQRHDVRATSPSSTSGIAITWKEKKRLSVASETTKSPRIPRRDLGPMSGSASKRFTITCAPQYDIVPTAAGSRRTPPPST